MVKEENPSRKLWRRRWSKCVAHPCPYPSWFSDIKSSTGPRRKWALKKVKVVLPLGRNQFDWSPTHHFLHSCPLAHELQLVLFSWFLSFDIEDILLCHFLPSFLCLFFCRLSQFFFNPQYTTSFSQPCTIFFSNSNTSFIFIPD